MGRDTVKKTREQLEKKHNKKKIEKQEVIEEHVIIFRKQKTVKSIFSLEAV